MYSNGPPHMVKQKQDDQLELTYSSYVRIRDVTLKTKLWMIGRSSERGPWISVLAARLDDDDQIVWFCFRGDHYYRFFFLRCLSFFTSIKTILYVCLSVCLSLSLYICIYIYSAGNDSPSYKFENNFYNTFSNLGKYWVKTAWQTRIQEILKNYSILIFFKIIWKSLIFGYHLTKIKIAHLTKFLLYIPFIQNNSIETDQNRTRAVLSCAAIFLRLN